MGNTTVGSPEQEHLEEELRELEAKNSALESLNGELLRQYERQKDQTLDLGSKNAELKSQHTDLEEKVAQLQEQVTLLELLHFGPTSEKLTAEDTRQSGLFNEAEDGAFDQKDEEQIAAVQETIEIGAHTRVVRKKAGRKKIDEKLPREVHVYDLDEEEKTCACGVEKNCIGEDVSERAKIIPARIVVLQERKKKYVCRSCEGTTNDEAGVTTAKGPVHLVPRSIADESLLAWSLSEKFEYGLPFYRQAKRLAYLGIPLPRATLSKLAIRVAVACEPVYNQLKEHILSGPLIHADETRVQVLNEPGRKAQSQSWMWVYVGGPVEKQVQRFCVLFVYSSSRSHENPYAFLKGYRGWLMSDDYEAYGTAVRKIHGERLERGQSGKIDRILCWAHARRKFHQAWEATRSPEADAVMRIIRELFGLEKLRPDYSLKGFAKQRKDRGEEILDRLWTRLRTLAGETPPSLALGRAVSYTLDNWSLLKRYLEDPILPPSNNVAENSIRPFVIGRKAWLFANTPDGAQASATMYSLVESAKASGLAPYDYLYYIMRQIPSCNEPADYARLLPHVLTPKMIKFSDEV
jgi:transposase